LGISHFRRISLVSNSTCIQKDMEDRCQSEAAHSPFALYSRHVLIPSPAASSLPVVLPACVVIAAGRILQVLKCESKSGLTERLSEEFGPLEVEDLGDVYICPGLVDINCCFNSDTGLGDDDSAGSDSAYLSLSAAGGNEEYWEDYATGTKAAAAGGVTTVIESPTLRYSNLLTAEAVVKKVRQVAEQALYCDVGLLGYAGSGNLSEIPAMAEAGVMGFTGYMVPPCAHLGYFESENDLKLGMEQVQTTQKVLIIHPERTTSRFLFMASPFRQQSREGSMDSKSPEMTCYAAAFPEDRECASSDSSPFVGTPQRLSPQQSEELERSILKHKENLENLVDVEMRSYGNSGDTYFTGSPLKRRSPISNRPDFGVLTQSNWLAPPLQSFRPPPISCRAEKRLSEASDYSALLANSPPHWEANGVAAVLKCMEETKCRVHIAALSSASAVCQVKKAKADSVGGNLTCEVSIPHLYFSSMNIRNGDTRFKANPVIRDPTNRCHLLELLRRGAVDCVCSAHRPIKPALKYLQSGNFQRALSGISDMGTSLSALWTLLKSENPSNVLPLISLLTSTRPAQILGLQSKGEIAVGKDADLVLFDPFASCEFSLSHLHVKHPELSPFLGEKISGAVLRTYLRGEVVYNGKDFHSVGRLLMPSC